jgi:hypothetical protein
MKMVLLFNSSYGVWVPSTWIGPLQEHGLAEECNGSYYWTGNTAEPGTEALPQTQAAGPEAGPVATGKLPSPLSAEVSLSLESAILLAMRGARAGLHLGYRLGDRPPHCGRH